MTLWRISTHRTLDGMGGLYAPARWHSRGNRVVYLADAPAGAAVEVLVHLELSVAALPRDYWILKASADGEIASDRVDPGGLPADWRGRVSATRRIGDQWLRGKHSALLAVPSVILPETTNWLLNPEHPDAVRMGIVSSQPFEFDPRLCRVA